MNNFERGVLREKREQDQFSQDAEFIKKHYPGDAERIINEALDGFQVVYEERDGEIIGLSTYDIATDNLEETYMLAGVTIIDPDYAGEDVGDALFQKRIEVAREHHASYITATADTKYGEAYLERLGFELVDDEVTGREHYRYDIEI